MISLSLFFFIMACVLLPMNMTAAITTYLNMKRGIMNGNGPMFVMLINIASVGFMLHLIIKHWPF